MTEELLPCPFCGSPGIEDRVNGDYYNARCSNNDCDLANCCMTYLAWSTRAQPKYKRVDLKRLNEEPVLADKFFGGGARYAEGFQDGFKYFVFYIKSKYGDLYAEVKK